MKLRVLLVDDHSVIRDALRMILETESDIEVVGEVADGRGVNEAVGQTHPDVVCMDVNMPHLNGIEATQQLLAVYPQVKVIGLSVHASQAIVGVIFSAGVTGYVIKADAANELAQAIRQVSQGQTYFSQGLGLTSVGEMARDARAPMR
jgi:DNA-binding NarL/FixJ family response regulator